MGRYGANRITDGLLGRTIDGRPITEVSPDPDIYGGGTVRTADGEWHQVHDEHDPKIGQ